MANDESSLLHIVLSKKRKKVSLDQCNVLFVKELNEMKDSQSRTEVGREKIIAGSRILHDNLLDDGAENDLFIIKYHSNSCYGMC